MPYLTPDTLPSARLCRRLSIPNDIRVVAAVSGALIELTKEYNWELFGEQSPADTAYAMQLMFQEFIHSEGCMIGLIMPYITGVLPANCLPCDGSTRLRVDYPDFYQLIEPGLRIDADTFLLPTIQGRFIFAASDDYPLYSFGGQPTVALTVDQLPEHNHTTEPHAHETLPHTHAEGIAVPTIVNGGIEAPASSAAPAASITGAATVTVLSSGVTVNSTGSGAQHENMPPYVCLNYCVIAR